MNNFIFNVPNEIIRKIKLSVLLLDYCSVPYSKNITFELFNSSRNYGTCEKRKSDFLIRINKSLINNNETELVQTIIHEILHTIDYEAGHSGLWKYYADLISSRTPFKIVSKYEMPETILNHLNVSERSLYIDEKKEQKDINNLLNILPAYYHYFSQKEIDELIFFILDNGKWECIAKSDKIKSYISKTAKKELYKKYLNGTYDFQITDLKILYWFEGFFALTDMWEIVTNRSKETFSKIFEMPFI